MEENNKKLIDSEIKINPKNNINKSFNKYRIFSQKDKKTIQSYLFKKNDDLMKYQKNNLINFNTSKINENSTKINSNKVSISSNAIKSKLEESIKTIESLNTSKLLSKKKIINLKNIWNSPTSTNRNLAFHSQKNTPVNNEKNGDAKDSGLKRYLLTKFKLAGNTCDKENKENREKRGNREKYTNIYLEKKKYNKLQKKYFSLADIQRYNDFIKFKTLKKNIFKDNNINDINDISVMNKTQKEFMKSMKNEYGIYSLPKSCKPNFNKFRQIFVKKQLDKNNKFNKNNSHLDIFNNFKNIKNKINKENKKMNKKIKNTYSELDKLKNYLASKRPNEDTHKGLEELFYIYNKKRAKKEKIITNRVINDNSNTPVVEMQYDFDNDSKNKKFNIINSHNITHIAQKKVNKLFHDLLIFQLPKLTDKKYIRKVLYDIFIEFKNLFLLSMMINKDININKKGIDFVTFYNCNTKINQQGKIIAKNIFEIFNKKMETKYMNLNNYINGMLKIKDTNKENKLDLFFEMLNNNSDGFLTYNDIYKLSLVCLQKITLNIEDEYDLEKYKKENDDKGLKIVEGLAEYFCKMIFKLVNIDINEKIPLKLLKKMIIQGGEQADYIELLFGSSKFT